MKYVDWVSREYASGDYSQVQAFIVSAKVGNESSREEFLESVRKNGKRFYTSDEHEAHTKTWEALTPVSYIVDEKGHIYFEIVK